MPLAFFETWEAFEAPVCFGRTTRRVARETERSAAAAVMAAQLEAFVLDFAARYRRAAAEVVGETWTVWGYHYPVKFVLGAWRRELGVQLRLLDRVHPFAPRVRSRVRDFLDEDAQALAPVANETIEDLALAFHADALPLDLDAWLLYHLEARPTFEHRPLRASGIVTISYPPFDVRVLGTIPA